MDKDGISQWDGVSSDRLRRLPFAMHSVNLRLALAIASLSHMFHDVSWFFDVLCEKMMGSRLCKELLLLPFGLAETSGVQKVVQCFSSYVKWLSEFPVPKEQDMASFTVLLKQILQAG